MYTVCVHSQYCPTFMASNKLILNMRQMSHEAAARPMIVFQVD